MFAARQSNSMLLHRIVRHCSVSQDY